MKTDTRNRAGAIVPAQSRGALAAKPNTALAQARALLNPQSITVLHVPITCARVGLTYLATGRRESDTLAIVSAVPMPKTRSAAPGSSAEGAGVFLSVSFPSGWTCPGCRRPHSGSSWACDCSQNAGALHTCGDAGRVGFCACGRSEILHFEKGNGATVRGSKSTPRAALNSVNAPQSAPALAPRVPPLLLPGKKG